MIQTHSRNSEKFIVYGLLAIVLLWLITSWYARHKYLPYDVNNTDIGTYLYQAQTFADGHLWRPTPEPREFFQQWQVIVRDRSYAYYPPGHALFLAIPLALGIDPWLFPWLISGCSLLLLFAWSRKTGGSLAAILAVVFMAFSPYFAANGASLLSHSFTLCLTLLFLYTSTCWQKDGKLSHAILTGLSLSFIFATRPLNAVALGAIWIPWVMWNHMDKSCPPSSATNFGATPARRGGWIGFTCSALFIFILLILYYHHISGQWRMDLFTDYWPRNKYGFGIELGRGEPGHYFQTYANHNATEMTKNWMAVFYQLALWWSGDFWFSIFILLVILIWVVLARFRKSNTSEPIPFIPLLLWPLLHVFLYSLYFTPSTFFSGPRYLFEILPALAFLPGLFFTRLWSAQKTSMNLIRACIILYIIGFITFACFHTNSFYKDNLKGVSARRHVEARIAEESKTPALIFIRSFWLGHPYPIFLNKTSLTDPILFACDRGIEDKKLVEKHPDRNAYILVVFPISKSIVKSGLVQVYDGQKRVWLKSPDEVSAPFFIGGRFTNPLQLKGETARQLFHPRPEEIKPQ